MSFHAHLDVFDDRVPLELGDDAGHLGPLVDESTRRCVRPALRAWSRPGEGR
jgi:hypothetical protein